MDRSTVLDRLRAHETELKALGLRSLALFGSVARNEQHDRSDVDLAGFLDDDRGIGVFGYSAIAERLQRILGGDVDFLTEPARKASLRDAIDCAASMSSSREADRLRDIVENIDRIGSYTADLDFDAFIADRKTIDAVERCLQRITEAIIKIGPERMAAIAPELPLSRVRGLGNALKHEYDVISLSIIWQTGITELPPLRAFCVVALA